LGGRAKVLNLFFRDALYNFYLREQFNLAKFEKYMEIPLDSFVGKELRNVAKAEVPRWRSVKGLSEQQSVKYQLVAAKIAHEKGTERVHLDVVYWRGGV
jgi:hypothetical protein